MNKALCTVAFFLAQGFAVFASQQPDSLARWVYDDKVYSPSIKTVLLHPLGQPMLLPVIRLKSGETLQLSFDDLSAEATTYLYTFIHCDAMWQPSDLIPQDYIEGFTETEITDHHPSFSTLQNYLHYSAVFPGNDTKLSLPGNYLLYVYEESSKEKPVITARFLVVSDQVHVTGDVHQATAIEERKYKQEADFTISSDSYAIDNPYADLKVCLFQNRRKDNALCGLKPLFIRDKTLDYNYDAENAFDGGSEFRMFDARSIRKNGERITSITHDFEGYHLMVEKDQKRSYLRYSFDHDLNGGFKIKTYDGSNDDLEADYVWVHLTLACDVPLEEGTLYVMGDFCRWNFDSLNTMTWDPSTKTYAARLYLKQGYYNYCYLFVPAGMAKGETSVVEGDHFETENDYIICVYHRAPGTHYDSLISVTTWNSLRK